MKPYLEQLPVVFALAIFGCQSSASLQEGPSLAKAQNSEKDTEQSDISAEEEGVVPPNNISGTYLSCAYESLPQEQNPEAFLGCRFGDDEGVRVPASSLGQAYTFTYRLPSASSLTIYAKTLVDDSRYDGAYVVFANDAATLLAEMNQTEIIASIQGELQSQQDLVVRQRFSEVQREASTISEPASLDYNAVRDEILTDAQNGEVTPPF